LIPCFFLLFSRQVLSPILPSEKNPVLFYSNQAGDDLKRVVLAGIEDAKKSLFLQIYGCTDPGVIGSLKNCIKRVESAEIFYDPSGSRSLNLKIPSASPLIRKGLMHKKILIVDRKKIFVGTANFTPTSLCMHDNVIMGLYDEKLANDLLSSPKNRIETVIKGQKIEFWHLPDFRNECLENTLQLLSEAKETLHIALFTFTHRKILDALLEAKQRGVTVKIGLDSSSAIGSGSKTVDLLRKNGIFPRIGKGGKLLHHKWCLIDKKTLILGSANWTKSAFTINEDCLLIVHNLTASQKKFFERVWKNIEIESVGNTK